MCFKITYLFIFAFISYIYRVIMYENVCSFDILIQVKSQNVGYQLGILTVRGQRRVEEHLLLSHNGSYGDISRS